MIDSLLELAFQAMTMIAGLIVLIGLLAVFFWPLTIAIFVRVRSKSYPSPLPYQPYLCRGGFLGMCDGERIIKNRINQQATTTHP